MAGRVMRPPKRVVWSGPVSECGPGFVAEVQRLGLTPLSVEHQSRLIKYVSDLGATTVVTTKMLLVRKR